MRVIMRKMSHVDKPLVFPVKRLANHRVCLEPFDIASHASIFVEGTKHHPKLFDYTTYGPFQSVKEFEDEFYWPRIGEKQETALWSIFTKQPADRIEKGDQLMLAGVLSLDNSSRVNGVTEIGHVRMSLRLSVSSSFHCLHALKPTMCASVFESSFYIRAAA